jgi:hypothetical protein
MMLFHYAAALATLLNPGLKETPCQAVYSK